MADYEVVASPSNYGAPNVFQNNQQQAQQGQQQQANPASALLMKAKDLLSRGMISSEQYNRLAQQYGGAAVSTDNPSQVFPGGTGDPYRNPGAPLNILPGQGG